MIKNSLEPFVKWAGGKRQLIPEIMKRLPVKYNNYYEPFIGGGALFFHLLPERAIINDINKELVNTYRQIKNNVEELLKNLENIDASIYGDGKEYYYDIRDKFNHKIKKNETDVEQAAMFLFLNKHCFNGLYRVNSEGLFNVPFNGKTGKTFDKEHIVEIHHKIQQTVVLEGDFEKACSEAKKGDFLFFDSPYAPLNPSSFESYTKEGFNVENHIRLSRLFDELTRKGCYCMLTNHNTPFINDLYKNKGYKMDVVSVKRLINSDAKNRKGEEVIIYNYDLEDIRE